MLESCLCNSEQTIVYQIIYSVVIGVIFSCFSCSLAVLLLFIILMECMIFSSSQHRYYPQIRIPVVMSYLAGWIIGRTIFEQEYCFVSWDYGREKFCDCNCCGNLDLPREDCNCCHQR